MQKALADWAVTHILLLEIWRCNGSFPLGIPNLKLALAGHGGLQGIRQNNRHQNAINNRIMRVWGKQLRHLH